MRPRGSQERRAPRHVQIPVQEMDIEVLEAVRTVAQRFADEEVRPLVGTEGRDGDLGRVPATFARAIELGLLQSSDVAEPDDDNDSLGVWALSPKDSTPETRTSSVAMSLAILEAIAEACAGFAARMHLAGLATRELSDCEQRFGNITVCIPQCDWRAGARAPESPLPEAVALADGVLNGRCAFAATTDAASGCVVYAAAPGSDGWQRLVVPNDAPGCRVFSVGRRTGLAALDVCSIEFTDVPLSACHALAPREPHHLLGPLLLGLSAISIGNARSALKAARRYATERRQGGKLIAEHDAIRLLIGSSAARVAGAAAHLSSAFRKTGSADIQLAAAAAAKLRIGAETEQAVTDCLQVFGGVGYMEDYRMEKRLRDAMTLTSSGLSPTSLTFLCEEGAA